MALFDGHLRTAIDKGVKPIGNGLARMGVTPDQLTVLGLTMSVATAVAIGAGHPMLGFWLLLGSAFPDLFDGAVAKASKSSSVRGAFFDSTADRVTDAFLLGGIAWYLGETEGFRTAMLAFAVLGVSTLISYMRAKAESLGFDAKGGLMERAERIIALCVGLVLNVLVPVLWVMLVLTSVTAVQRFVKVWRQAGRPPVPVVPEPTRPLRDSRLMEARGRRRAAQPSRRTGSAQRSPLTDRVGIVRQRWADRQTARPERRAARATLRDRLNAARERRTGPETPPGQSRRK